METKVSNLFVLISKKRNEEVIDFLLKYGLEVRDEEKRTALVYAALYNNIELITWLLDNKADINSADKNGYTALHFACEKVHMDAVRVLISRGANINKPDYYGNTPSWIAATHWKSEKNLALLKELYHNNANLAQKNNAGYSVLDILPINIMSAL